MGDVLNLAAPIANGGRPIPEAEPFGRVEPIRDVAGLHERYYVRLAFEDRAGILGQVAGIFAEAGVSLAQVSQPAHAADEPASLVVVTHLAQESDVRAALARIESLDGVERVASVIRVEDTDAWKREAIGA